MDERLTSPEVLKDSDDQSADQSLRPNNLDEYYGQTTIKKNIKISITAAQKRKEPIDHVLLYGPPGLGKTTLAKVIANELGVSVRITSGPAIERTGDLASILTNLEPGDILFVDEIHRLNKAVEETLYPAMEDRALDLIVGKGPAARTLRLELNPFTIIGATTRVGLMGGPMRDRFGSIHRLDFYNLDELKPIIKRSAAILGIHVDDDAIFELAQRSRGTPRIANRLLRRVRDYAEVEANGSISPSVVLQACEMLGVNENGLDYLDRKYLDTIHQTFDGGPVGIETIAAALAEDVGTLEDVVEPFLIQLGMIKKPQEEE